MKSWYGKIFCASCTKRRAYGVILTNPRWTFIWQFSNIYLTKLVTWISHFQMRGRHESQVSSTTFWRKFLGNLKTQNFNRILLLANFFLLRWTFQNNFVCTKFEIHVVTWISHIWRTWISRKNIWMDERSKNLRFMWKSRCMWFS